MKFTRKEAITADAATVVKEFEIGINTFMKHLAKISHQYSFMKELKENLSDNEVVLHIDFSENFACKYSSEVQSIHSQCDRSPYVIRRTSS